MNRLRQEQLRYLREYIVELAQDECEMFAFQRPQYQIDLNHIPLWLYNRSVAVALMTLKMTDKNFYQDAVKVIGNEVDLMTMAMQLQPTVEMEERLKQSIRQHLNKIST